MGIVFSPTDYNPFTLFSFSHVAMILFFGLVFIASVQLFSKSLTQKNHKVIVWTLTAILLFSELTYQIWSLSVGIWDARYFIPIQLCSFSTFFGMYLLFRKSTSIFYFFFYVAFFPPVFALLTPDLVYGFPHYFYWKFFFQHIAIPITAIYLLYRDHTKLPVRSMFIAFAALNAAAIPIGFVNSLLDANYFFLAGPPVSDTALSLFGEGWVYILQLEAVAIVFFFLTFLIGKGLLKKKKALL
ncbi:TIGR02206 family membrane protein [Jeotgalibacillus proteolyticus]|uniref:TMEM164-related integral membrane acyltransferase n=1 Tax=Jeotgalibacillus proteolyticus TaxID=2082395 RepID=UPI003CF7C6DF